MVQNVISKNFQVCDKLLQRNPPNPFGPLKVHARQGCQIFLGTKNQVGKCKKMAT
jgi:hypothetical protein